MIEYTKVISIARYGTKEHEEWLTAVSINKMAHVNENQIHTLRHIEYRNGTQ